MTDNQVDTFVEELLGNRAPSQFDAAVEDRDIMRVAITLRAQRSDVGDPDPAFVEQLHRQLASVAPGDAAIVPLVAGTRFRGEQDLVKAGLGADPAPFRRVSRHFQAVAKAAAAALLVAGTFTATHLADRSSPVPVVQGANARAVRSGVLLSATGLTLGRAYTYTGTPTWVFMDVQSSGLSGAFVCRLQLADGTTIPAGVVTVYDGAGDWAHTVKVAASELRGATLVAPNGAVMARATFS